MAKTKKNGVWIATLDRFGYDLTVASNSKKKCREALSAEYQKAYAGRNGNFDMNNEEDKEYYETAMGEIFFRFHELDVVEWY